MAPKRVRFALLVAFLGLASVVSAQLGPSRIVSAKIESAAVVADKASIHVKVRNVGEHPITAFPWPSSA